MSDTGDDKPTHQTSEIQLPDQVTHDPVTVSAATPPPFWIWLCVAALFIVALLVIFVLPTVVSQYQLPLEPKIDPVQLTSISSSSATSEISPFEQAQLARQRKEAQDILSEILEVQTQLESLMVEYWASNKFEAALEVAGLGDSYYREQNFIQASQSYSQGLSLLQEILNSKEQFWRIF